MFHKEVSVSPKMSLAGFIFLSLGRGFWVARGKREEFDADSPVAWWSHFWDWREVQVQTLALTCPHWRQHPSEKVLSIAFLHNILYAKNNPRGFIFSLLRNGKKWKGLKIFGGTEFLLMASPNHYAAQRFKGTLFLPELILWTLQALHELDVFFLGLFFNTHSAFSYESLRGAACSPEFKSLAHSSLQL